MNRFPNVEHLIRNRLLRIAVAVGLILLSVWAFVPYIAYRVAPSAFINAELVRVTAPIAGRLTQDLPRKGDFIAKPTPVTLIQALAPDRRHLLDLERQYAVAKDNAELARTQLAEISTMDAELGKRTDAYRDGVVSRLEFEIEEAEAERQGCLAEASQRRDVGSRMEALAKAGNASQIRSSEALASQEATLTRCRMADARVHRLETELSSARNGVFLRDGANDAPYSQQQRDRLMLRRQEMQTQLLQESARVAALDDEIVEERKRLAQVNSYDLPLPAAHVVWSVAASPGSAVTEGQPLLDFADCQRRFVAVELPERDFEQIKPGDPAVVRLIGSNEWVDGEIRQVRGSAARADDRLLAAQVPTPNAGNITVEVALSGGTNPADGRGFCNIGRLAEVRFQRSGFGLARGLGRLWQWLTFAGPPAPKTVVSNDTASR